MAGFRLYKSPTGEIVRVKLGFSWHAFFIDSLSAILRRTWLLASIAALFFVTIVYASGSPSPSSRTVAFGLALLTVYVAYMIFCGVHASRWLVDSLRRRGYTLLSADAAAPGSTKSTVKKPSTDAGRPLP